MQPMLSRVCGGGGGGSPRRWMLPGLAAIKSSASVGPLATNAATAIGRQGSVKLDENEIGASLTQAHGAPGPMDEAGADPTSLLGSLEASKEAAAAAASVGLALGGGEAKLRAAPSPAAGSVAAEAGPLPFEEVPGPALLKLWEKYWRYVPLFGTQLLRSLLINGLVEGRLYWNRNITPTRYLFNEYGPVVRLHGPFTGDIVLIHRPEHVTKLFEEEGDSPSRSGIDVLQYYRLHHRKYRFCGPVCAEGAQAAEWIQTKKSLDAPLTDQINKHFGKLEMACEDLMLRIRQIKNRQDEVPGNFNEELCRWGMECFWVLMLNKKLGFLDATAYNESAEATRFIEALNEAHWYMSRCETGFQVWRFFETPFSKKLFSACDIIDGTIGKYIRSAQSSIRADSMAVEQDKQSRPNLLEILLSKQRMNPDDLSTILMDMIILGVQATTNSEAFLLYYLAKNPRVQRNVFDEVVSKIRDDPLFTRKTFDNMPYLSACIKECLRLRPPFPYISRLLTKNITLHGYKIPKGVYITIANEISSRREENFEDADKFKPERWLNAKDNLEPRNSYLPFGKGLRSCIGEYIAELQMKMMTSKIIREFRVEYDYADINNRFLMMNVPNKPLRFRFVDRD